jgi:hypothetical protein
MDDPAAAAHEALLMLLAELHDAVVDDHPRVASWTRHCMFRLTDDPAQFEVIADVEFDEWERSGAVDPLASLATDELEFLLSYLRRQAREPEGLHPVVLDSLDAWIAELDRERTRRHGAAPRG